jgi:hypothetical protein
VTVGPRSARIAGILVLLAAVAAGCGEQPSAPPPADTPATGPLILSARVVVMKHGRVVPPETGGELIVDVDLEDVRSGGPGEATQTRVESSPDEEGRLRFPVEPGHYRITGHGTLYRGAGDSGPSNIEGMNYVWNLPDEIEGGAGDRIDLPDLVYVEPIRVLGPTGGAECRLSESPVLRWEPWPGAAEYRVRVSRVRSSPGSESFAIFSEFTVRHPESRADWGRIENGVPRHRRLDETPPRTGGYDWSVTALDEEGHELSKSLGNRFSIRPE